MTHTFVSVGPNASIGEAASLMASSGVSGLLVMDDTKRAVGVITEGDLIRREALGHAPPTSLWRTLFTNDRTLARAFAKAYGRRVEEVMSREIFSVRLSRYSLRQILRLHQGIGISTFQFVSVLIFP